MACGELTTHTKSEATREAHVIEHLGDGTADGGAVRVRGRGGCGCAGAAAALAALREAALRVVVVQWWGSGEGGGGGGGGVSCGEGGEGGGVSCGEGGEGGESGEAHLAREKVVDTKLVKVERPPRLLARLRDCVRADL